MPNFARVAGPLHMLTRSDVPFVWTDTCQKAFEQLKNLLITTPVLVYPNFSQPFQLHTDASGQGLGAVLEQQLDGESHPVAFASRTLSRPEQHYGITELETLAVVWSLRHFRAYLCGHKVTVYTDHAPVRSMLKTKHPSGKLARWAESVAELDVEILYRPGCKNANADALSRSPLIGSAPKEEPEIQVAFVTAQRAEDSSQLVDNSSVIQSQSEDSLYSAMTTYLKSGVVPSDPELL